MFGATVSRGASTAHSPAGRPVGAEGRRKSSIPVRTATLPMRRKSSGPFG